MTLDAIVPYHLPLSRLRFAAGKRRSTSRQRLSPLSSIFNSIDILHPSRRHRRTSDMATSPMYSSISANLLPTAMTTSGSFSPYQDTASYHGDPCSRQPPVSDRSHLDRTLLRTCQRTAAIQLSSLSPRPLKHVDARQPERPYSTNAHLFRSRGSHFPGSSWVVPRCDGCIMVDPACPSGRRT